MSFYYAKDTRAFLVNWTNNIGPILVLFKIAERPHFLQAIKHISLAYEGTSKLKKGARSREYERVIRKHWIISRKLASKSQKSSRKVDKKI